MEEELNITNIVNNEIKPVEQLQTNLQKQATAKQQGTNSLYDSLQSSYFGGTGIQETAIKPSIEYQVPIEEGYALVGNEYVSRFPTYQSGRDNYEYAAQNQTTFDKWTNGLIKAGANILTTIAGNTVGFVIGAAEGAKEGSWNAVFDNKFSNTLADWNEKLNYQLPNYVTKDEQNNNFAQSLRTANFWANDVMGGVSFTIGTIVSEAMWAYATGGIANSAKWAVEGAHITNKLRWGKVALGAEEAAVGVANYKKLVADGVGKVFETQALTTEMLRNAKIGAYTSKFLNTARFLATTSGNEAGIEALHYKREQRENFYRNFETLNGRQPSEAEIESFETNLENAANAVFATNMAILAPSNISMFGSLFNINSPVKGISKAMNKSLFGIGVEKVAGEAGEIAYKGLQATGKQKVAQYTYSALKPLLTEGIWEEGLQGVTTKSAENWITSTYDPKYSNKAISLSDATYKAFAEQYGSKEGWKEIGIGAIIGLGSSIILGGGKLQEVQEFNKEQQYQQDYVAKGLNQFGDQSALATDSIVRSMMLNARITNAVERQKSAIDKGDDVSAALSQQDALIAEMQFRKSIGENTKNLVSKYTTAVNAIPESDLIDEGIEDPKAFKSSIIDGYKTLVNSYERASDFADAVLGDSKILGQDIQTQTLKDALTYSIVSGEKANKAMDGLLQDMGKIIGDDSVKSMQIQTDLQKLGKAKQQQVRRLNTNINQAENEVKTLSEVLQKLQVSKDEEKGARLQQVQQKLNESVQNLSDLKAEREVLAQEVSQESKRRRTLTGLGISDVSLSTEFITGEDLADIDQKLQRIEDSIKSYEGVNHALYYDLLDLKRQYISAKENFFSFQASVDAIINGKMKLKFSKVNGLLGKIFDSKDPIDDFTGKYLDYINTNYQKSVGQNAYDVFTEKIISDEDYSIFKGSNEVSENIINDIANKVKRAETLSPRENEIFQAKSAEINTLLTPNPNKPDLNPVVEEVVILTPAEELRNAINKAFEKDYPMLTQDPDEMIKGKPTEQEKDRYQTLYKLRNNFTEKEAEEFSNLQPRMQRWFMAESLPVAGNTIADLIELLDQLETQINRDETLTEVDDDLLIQETAEQKSANSIVRQDILQNISGNAVTKIKENNIYFIHVNPRTVLDPLILNSSISTVQTVNAKGNLNKAQDLTESLLNSEIKKPGTIFTIGGIKITIGERGSTVMSLDDYNKVKDVINLHYFDSNSGKWSYADLYERLEDGTTRKKASEFKTNTVSDYIYDLEEGDSLNLFVDMKTDFNRDLIYQSLASIEKNGNITDELKKQILNTLEITSRQNNKNNSTLKAMYSDVEFDNFAYVRKKYADKFIELLETEQGLATLPNKIDLSADLAVKELFLGTPNLQLNENNVPRELPITERGVDKVISQGYVKSSEMFLGDKSINIENISRLYITNLVKANPELKIPVVILNKGVHQFAFPITMTKVVENREQALDDILTALETNTEVTKAINNLMISLGLDTRLVQTTPEDIDRIRTELQNYEAFRTADEIADVNYNKNSLIQDATIKIDLEDTLISSPKITVDYSTLTIGNAEETENDVITVRQDIVNDLREIERIINRTPEMPDRNNLVQAFDENAVENKGTDIMNRKDINFIKKVFFTEDGKVKTVRGTAVDIIGRDKIYRLGEKLKTLQFYENQIKTIKDKNVERNLNCN